MVETITANNQKYALQAQNLKQYFDNMAIYEVVTPVREVTEFIEDDLLATDPKYLGDIYNAIQRVDFQHKKINNAKVDAKKPWILMIAIVAIVGVLGFMGYSLISNGGLQGILPSLPSFTPSTSAAPNAPPPPGVKLTDAQVFAKYPTPDALEKAIQNGDIQMNQLSPKVQAMIKSYKPPTPSAITP